MQSDEKTIGPATPAGPRHEVSTLSAEKIKRRIFVPLILAVAVLLASYVMTVLEQQQSRSRLEARRSAEEVQRLLRQEQKENIAAMASELHAILNDERLAVALRAGDRAALLQRALPLFHTMSRQSQITHFYFHSPDRVNLLRVHCPEKSGDLINRSTLLEAERTGEMSSGIERGPLGSFVSRVVIPWRENGELLGYVELGIDFADTLREIHGLLGVDFVAVVEKKSLARAEWESHSAGLPKRGSWEQFPEVVIIDQTMRELPPPVAAMLAAGRPFQPGSASEVSWNGSTSQLLSLTLEDAHGTGIGGLFVLRDATHAVQQTRKAIWLICAISCAVSGVLLGLFYLFLGRVQKTLTGQTAKLRAEIAERKQAEGALSASKSRLEAANLVNQQILDNSLDVICTIDAEGRFTTLNRACEKLWGYTPAELIGRRYMELVHPEDQARTSEIAAAIVAGQAVRDFGNRYICKDGSLLPVTWSAKWSDADQGMFCVARDSTERERTEEAQTARKIAESANRAKSDFLSRMSHELRTPMNAILGFAQLLETGEDLTADHRESVDQILKGGHHLLGLINEVLDLSTIEAGHMTLSPEAVPLEDILKESVALLQPLTKEFQIRLAVLRGDAAGRYVLADRQRLKQVLLNLLGNAIKYNRRGGSVTVRATVREGGAAIRLSVTDTGAGLSPERLALLFQPFERLGAEQSTVEGSGLGLVLAKRMVEHMGGTLGVESVVGDGTTFWIELPTAESPAEREDPCDLLVADPANAGGRRLVVYIEDNRPNLVLIKRILARRPGVSVISATDGRLGLGVVRDERPDLVLLDLNLPDISGQEVLARLRADPRTSEVPVIVLSADATPGQIARLLASGASGYLTKPLDVRKFLAAVDGALGFDLPSLTEPAVEVLVPC